MASWCEGQGATMEVSTATIMVALAHWMQGAYAPRQNRTCNVVMDAQGNRTWYAAFSHIYFAMNLLVHSHVLYPNLPESTISTTRESNHNRLASQAISSSEEPSLVRISGLVKANVLFYFEFQCKFSSILQTTGLYYRTAKLEVRGSTLRVAILGAVVTV